METFDTIVVGGGVVGSCTAYSLAKRGKHTLLLEQHEFGHKHGSSHGPSRIIRRTYAQQHFTQLMGKAYDLWHEIEAESSTPLIMTTGGIDIGVKDDALFASLVEHGVAAGVGEVVTADWVRTRFPMLKAPDNCDYFYTPESGVIDADKAVKLMQDLSRKHGAVLRDHAKVVGIFDIEKEEGEEGPWVGLRVVSGEGEETVVRARSVVLSPGPWIVKMLSTQLDIHLHNVVPTQITVAYWRVENGKEHQLGTAPIVLYYSPNFIYHLPAYEYPDLIKVCYHHGPAVDPDTRDYATHHGDLDKYVVPFIKEHFERVTTEGGPVESYTCMYTYTPTEDFIIDKLARGDKAAIFVAGGMSGHGFKLAPLTGELLANLVIDGKSEIAHDEFKITRDDLKAVVGE